MLLAIGQQVDKERTGLLLLSSASMVCGYIRVSTHSNVTNSLQSFVTPQIPSLSTVRCLGLHYPAPELIAFVLFRVFPCLRILVHARYTGTGHADLTKWEWATHQHRDTLSSIVGHPALTSFVALADNESIGRVKFEMTEVRLDSVVVASATLTNPAFVQKKSGCYNPADHLLKSKTKPFCVALHADSPHSFRMTETEAKASRDHSGL